MAQLPTKDRVEIRSRTYLAILEISVGNPMLGPKEIAALLQRNLLAVNAVMRSDAFLEQRAKLILERYGKQIEKVRGNLLDTANEVLDAIKLRISNPDAEIPVQVLIEAGKFLMPYVTPTVDDPNAQQNNGNVNVNLTLTSENMNRAQQLQAQRARSIELKSLPAVPSLPSK